MQLKPNPAAFSSYFMNSLVWNTNAGEKCSGGCSERRHKIFNDHAEYLTALSSRLQVLHSFHIF